MFLQITPYNTLFSNDLCWIMIDMYRDHILIHKINKITYINSSQNTYIDLPNGIDYSLVNNLQVKIFRVLFFLPIRLEHIIIHLNDGFILFPFAPADFSSVPFSLSTRLNAYTGINNPHYSKEQINIYLKKMQKKYQLTNYPNWIPFSSHLQFSGPRTISSFIYIIDMVLQIAIGYIIYYFLNILQPFRTFKNLRYTIFPYQNLPICSTWQNDESFIGRCFHNTASAYLQKWNSDIYQFSPIQIEKMSSNVPLFNMENIYCIDMRLFQNMKYTNGYEMPYTIAFFHVSKEVRILMIDVNNQIFTPLDSPIHWLLAKICVDSNILNYNFVIHLLFFHSIPSLFETALARNIHYQHPIWQMLKHIFLYTNNFDIFVHPSIVSHDFLGLYLSVDSMKEIAKNLMNNYTLEELQFDKYLEKYKINVEKVPPYLFAQDGLALWNINLKYIHKTLDAIYSTKSIEADENIQSALKYFVNNIKLKHNFYEPFRIEDASRIICTVIHMISWHSEMHITTKSSFIYAPSTPFSLRIDKNTYNNLTKVKTEYDIIKILPEYHKISAQKSISTHVCLDIKPKIIQEQYERINEIENLVGITGKMKKIFQKYIMELNELDEKIDLRNRSMNVMFEGFKPTVTMTSIRC